MHGMMMVFFFLIPSIPAVLGNFLVPMMIGAKDLAFPRINLLSWYLYIIGGVMMLHCMLTGGVDTGWTFYTPFSTAFTNTKVVEAGLAIFVAGFSSILTGLNFVVTIHRMRAPGMTWSRLPLFIWAHYATSIIQILGTPVIAITSCWWLPNAPSISASSIPSSAAIRCSSSTCSGSIRIPPSTS